MTRNAPRLLLILLTLTATFQAAFAQEPQRGRDRIAPDLEPTMAGKAIETRSDNHLAHLAKRLEKATVSERATITDKVRALTPGSEDVVALSKEITKWAKEIQELEICGATNVITVARCAVRNYAAVVYMPNLIMLKGLYHAVIARHFTNPAIRFDTHQPSSTVIVGNTEL